MLVITKTMSRGLSSSLWEFIRSIWFWRMQNSAERPSTLRPSQSTWAASSL